MEQTTSLGFKSKFSFNSHGKSPVRENVEPKSLILCLDGTDNEFGPKPFTNVLKLYTLLDKNNELQICYYQSGIGSSYKAESTKIVENNFVSSKYNHLNSRIDAMIAFSLSKHVLDAYEFLAKNYKSNDKVFLFGFSRGSFTARIVAGMIELVGLVHNASRDTIVMAWDIYNNWEQAGQPAHDSSTFRMAQEFKKTFSRRDVKIHFMGLWDSINSIGFLWDHNFPYTIRSCNVRHIRHAVSIDERRSKYKPQLFDGSMNNNCCTSEDVLSECSSCTSQNSQTSFSTYNGLVSLSPSLTSIGGYLRRRFLGSRPGFREPPLENNKNDVVEVFFPGDHADIGGGWATKTDGDGDGYIDGGTVNGQSLSNVSLRWMLAQAVKHGVNFRQGALREWSLKFPSFFSMTAKNHDALSLLSQTKTMPAEVKIDNKGPLLPSNPINGFAGRSEESLAHLWFWWVLECLPVFYKCKDQNSYWRRAYEPNLGHQRVLPIDCVLHWSFFYRLHYISDYCPKNVTEEAFPDQFLHSLVDFKVFKFNELKDYAKDITLEKIKHDWESSIWKKIPDELAEISSDFATL